MKKIVLALAIIAFATFFTACGDDEEELSELQKLVKSGELRSGDISKERLESIPMLTKSGTDKLGQVYLKFKDGRFMSRRVDSKSVASWNGRYTIEGETMVVTGLKGVYSSEENPFEVKVTESYNNNLQKIVEIEIDEEKYSELARRYNGRYVWNEYDTIFD